MNTYSNQSNIRVRGNGNHIGGNNVIDNRREYHHHHGKSSRRRGDDGKGEGAAILFAALTIVWFFSKHAYEIYEYIKIGALFTTAPFFMVFIAGLVWEPEDNKSLYGASIGLVISMVTIMLAHYGIVRLDPQVVEIGQQSNNAWIFWQSLTGYGHKLVLGGLAGAIFTGATVLLSIFMGAYLLWCATAASYFEYGYIPRFLRPFRPSLAGVVTALFLLAAWVFISGFAFKLMS